MISSKLSFSLPFAVASFSKPEPIWKWHVVTTAIKAVADSVDGSSSSFGYKHNSSGIIEAARAAVEATCATASYRKGKNRGACLLMMLVSGA